jgi:hypothetical protein
MGDGDALADGDLANGDAAAWLHMGSPPAAREERSLLARKSEMMSLAL